MILELGVVEACNQGYFCVSKFSQVKKSIDLYKLCANKLEPIDTMEHEWHWGPTGTGKSYEVHKKYPNAYKKTGTKWWDGYD